MKKNPPATVLSFYDGKVVDMGYVPDPKRRFSFAGMRALDNAPSGYIIDGTKVYSVSRAYRMAKIMTGEAAQAVLAEVERIRSGGENAAGIDTSDAGTKDTMPMHHWMHSVISAARVDRPSLPKSVIARMHRAFNAGEPVWMAAHELRTTMHYRGVAERAEGDDPLRIGRRGNRAVDPLPGWRTPRPRMSRHEAAARADVEERRMLEGLPPATIGRGQSSKYLRCFQGRAPIVGSDAAHASCLEEATRQRGFLGRAVERFAPNTAGTPGAMTSNQIAGVLRHELAWLEPYEFRVVPGSETTLLHGLMDDVTIYLAMVPRGSSQLDAMNARRSAIVSIHAPEWSQRAVEALGPYGSRPIGEIPAARVRAEATSSHGMRMRAKTGTPEQVIRHVVAFFRKEAA
jgi:hypothetical protein